MPKQFEMVHIWFKSDGDFAEWIDFAYWWSCLEKGLSLHLVLTMVVVVVEEKLQNSECSGTWSAPRRQRHTNYPPLERGCTVWFGLGIGGAMCSVNLYILIFSDEPI